MLKRILFIFAAIAWIGCSGEVTTEPAAETAAEAGNGNGQGQLQFEGELTEAGALALGVMQLDASGLPITESQAETMLPLWQALQALTTSDTAADLEIQAVVGQIENELSADQQAAIDRMDLSMDEVNRLVAEGALALGRGQAGQGGQRGQGGDGGGGGGQRGQGGGPVGGGGGQGGGPLGGGQLSDEEIATRQAQFTNGTAADRILINAVIQNANGVLGIQNPREVMNRAINEVIADAAGLTVEALREQYSEGETALSVLTTAGVDPDQVKADLISALEALDLGDDIDPATIAENALRPPGSQE